MFCICSELMLTIIQNPVLDTNTVVINKIKYPGDIWYLAVMFH